MTSRPTPTCDHELRPGTTVCLRCQHAERGARRARQRRMMARGGAAIALLAVIVAAGIAGASALRSRTTATSGESNDTSPVPQDVAGAAMADSAPVASAAVVPPAATTPAAAGPTLAAVSPVAPRRIPVTVPMGRTPLQDSLLAERAGDTVRVLFDRLMTRTRRADKFEAIMRSTLPDVFGALADSALRALPEGAVARAGDLVTALPERGLRIPVAGGGSIAVWPETRPGRDGPLVVAYRAVADR